MKNYNEIIKSVKNYEEMEVVINQINEDIINNIENTFAVKEIEQAIKNINAEFEREFFLKVVANLEENRRVTFEHLIKNPSFDRVTFDFNENHTIKLEKKKSIFKFANLEKFYQLYKSEETDKKNNPIANKSVTVFGALRFYGLCDAFIRNMFIGNVASGECKLVDISKVIVDNEAIFEDDNGKTFASGSNSALERQVNCLVKFFGLDVKLLKKDLPILKLSAQRIKKDTSNKSSINEVKTLKFVDVLFSVITSRFNNEDVKIFTNDGNEVKATEEVTTEA